MGALSDQNRKLLSLIVGLEPKEGVVSYTIPHERLVALLDAARTEGDAKAKIPVQEWIDREERLVKAAKAEALYDGFCVGIVRRPWDDCYDWAALVARDYAAGEPLPAPPSHPEQAVNAELVEALTWIRAFADLRSKDDGKVFARVNRGALRHIAERAGAALNPLQAGKEG